MTRRALSRRAVWCTTLLACVCVVAPAMAADDFPDGDADMPEGDEDEPIEEPTPSKPPPKPGEPPKKPAEPAKKPVEPAKKPVDDVDDDILTPADDEEQAPRVAPTPAPKPAAPVDDGTRTPRRMVVDEEEAVEFARPKRERRTVTEDAKGAERGERTPLSIEETKRLDPEEPEPSAYDPLMLGVIAGGAGVGAVVVVGVIVTSLIVTGPLVLNLWQIPGLTPPTETGSITVSPK